MGVAYHSVYVPDGLGLNLSGVITMGTATATYASQSAGVTSTIAVTWTEPVVTPYCILPSMVEDATWFITSKTTLGFTLNIFPRLAANSLAGGTVEILVIS